MKRKVAGISLFFCLVAPLMATFTYLHYQKSLVRKEVLFRMIASMGKDELVFLKITEKESQTELRWEHPKEFEYKGQMYDIVEKKIIGDTVYYWCWWDHEETKLNKQLDKLVAYALKNDPNRRENQKRLVHFFKSLYWEQFPDWHAFPSQSEQMITTYGFYYLTISYPPPVPPPEIA